MFEEMEKWIHEGRTQSMFMVENANQYVNEIKKLYTDSNASDITIVASGSSYNAAVCAKYLMKKVLQCNVHVTSPFTFEKYEMEEYKDTFIILISQSGYSTNTISAASACKEHNIDFICLTGDLDSDLKHYSKTMFEYGVGKETVGYVTKGVLTLATYLQLFALQAGKTNNSITTEMYVYYIDEIKKALNAHALMVDKAKTFYETNKKQLLSMDHVYVCSCGASSGIMLEGALKMGETICIPSFAYEIEEYIHGAVFQITPKYNVFFIDSEDCASARVQKIYEATRAVSDRTYILSNTLKDDHSIGVDMQIDALVTPLYKLPFFQYIAFKIASTLQSYKGHPMYEEFDKILSCKTENYKNSSLAMQHEKQQ